MTIKGNGASDEIYNNSVAASQEGVGIYVKASSYIHDNVINIPGWGIYAYSDESPMQYTINNNQVTSDIALWIWSSDTSGTGCGNIFNGEVRNTAGNFVLSETCEGQPPTNTPTLTPTPTTIVVTPTHTKAPTHHTEGSTANRQAAAQ